MDTHWFRYIYPKNLSLFQNEKLVAPEISLGGNFAYDRMGQFYHTTKIYGYIKKKDIEYSYEFLLGLLNSRLFWFFIQKTGYVLRGGYYTFKTNYITPFPIPDIKDVNRDDYSLVETCVQKISKLNIKRNPIGLEALQKTIDITICKIYDVDPSNIEE